MSSTLQAISQRAAARSIAQRARHLVTALNLHFAGLLLLGLINLYLLFQIVFTWQQVRSQNADAMAQQTVALEAARAGAQPLQGLDAKLATATGHADAFYVRRLPSAYSQVLAELGALANKQQHLRLTGVQYAQSPVLEGTSGELTQVQMDANLAGDYRGLVLFINSLERDKLFFLINTISLTGQQTGAVNLRIRLTTYLRARAPGDPVPPLTPATDTTTLTTLPRPVRNGGRP
jgi:type IV pilus assembly protein PilO